MGYTYEQLKSMGATPGTSSGVTSAAPVVTSEQSIPKKKYTYEELVKAGATPVTVPEQPQGDGMVMGMLKGVVSAPATMVARPIQAVQSAWQLAGMDIKGNEAKAKALSDEAYRLVISARTAPESEKLAMRARAQELNNQAMAISKKLGEDANWKPSAGGIIAEAPENFGDVKKDIGRGIQTVALGINAPLAGGAAFGVGSSLEQGNDLFSWDTAASALLGLGFAKGFDKFGKPVINYVGGKLAGFVPKDLKAVAARGEQAVLDFMKQHKLLEGRTIPGVDVKVPGFSRQISDGAWKFDDTINKKAGSLWQGTKNVVKSQYPDVKKNYQTKFENTEVNRFTDVLDGDDTKYYNARKVLDDSKLSVDDIKQTLKAEKTYAMHNTDGKSYQTMGAADKMTDKTMNNSSTILRPGLREAEGESLRVTTDDFKKALTKKIAGKDYSQFSPQEKADMMEAAVREYGKGSPNSRVFDEYGYGLEDTYNAQLNANKYVYSQSEKTGITSFADNALAARKKLEAEVFKDFLIERAPKRLGIENYLKEQQKRFVTANFLRSLDGKPIPRNAWQRAARATTRLFGGAVGLKLGGPFAIIPGSQAGLFADDMFMKATNPIKVSLLRELKVPEVEAYKIMKDFVSKSQFDKLWLKTPRLNAPTAIPMGPYTPPIVPSNTVGNNITQNSRRLFNTLQLPAPEARIITPNTQGTPNVVGAPYPSNPEVGGIRQRIFKGKK